MLTKKNIWLLVLSAGLLVVGFILLGQGPINNHLSWSVAPVILVLVYCFLLPFSIVARDKQDDKDGKQK
jgi:hypothetical protein